MEVFDRPDDFDPLIDTIVRVQARRLHQAGTRFGAAPVPVPRTQLIGRDDELDQLACRLKGYGVRLLSITGVGGSGKTRLALAVADDFNRLMTEPLWGRGSTPPYGPRCLSRLARVGFTRCCDASSVDPDPLRPTTP